MVLDVILFGSISISPISNWNTSYSCLASGAEGWSAAGSQVKKCWQPKVPFLFWTGLKTDIFVVSASFAEVSEVLCWVVSWKLSWRVDDLCVPWCRVSYKGTGATYPCKRQWQDVPQGGYLTNFNTGRLRPEVQPLTLLYTFYLKRVPLSHTYFRKSCSRFHAVLNK